MGLFFFFFSLGFYTFSLNTNIFLFELKHRKDSWPRKVLSIEFLNWCVHREYSIAVPNLYGLPYETTLPVSVTLRGR